MKKLKMLEQEISVRTNPEKNTAFWFGHKCANCVAKKSLIEGAGNEK